MSANVLKLFVIIGLFAVCNPMQTAAQTSWAATGGADLFDKATDLIQTADGNFAITVFGDDTGDFTFTTVKFDTDGNKLWVSAPFYPSAIEVPTNITSNLDGSVLYITGYVGVNQILRVIALDNLTGTTLNISDSWSNATDVNTGLSAQSMVDVTDSLIVFAASGDQLIRYTMENVNDLAATQILDFPDAPLNPQKAITASTNMASNIQCIAGTTQLGLRPYVWAFSGSSTFYYEQLPTDSILINCAASQSDGYIQLCGNTYDSSALYIALYDTTAGLFSFVMDTVFATPGYKIVGGTITRLPSGEYMANVVKNPGTTFATTSRFYFDTDGSILFEIPLLEDEQGVELNYFVTAAGSFPVINAGNIYTPESFGYEYLTTYSPIVDFLPACALDCVWPGDADNNGIVDMTDLFPIGITYGQSGFGRDSASTYWVGNKVDDWASEIFPELNTHYADTWGDGVITDQDTFGIIDNYSDTHVLNTYRLGGAGFPLWLNTAGITLTPGYNEIPIMLGDEITSVDAIYALAFSISYEGPPVIDSTTVAIYFDDSWMGIIDDMLQLDYNFPEQYTIDAGATNLDLNNRSGFGQIGRLAFIVEDNIAGILVGSGDSTIIFNINSASAIKNDYSPVDLSTSTYEVVVGINQAELSSFEQTIFPNPFHNGNIYIKSSDIRFNTYQIIDMQGNIIEGGDINNSNLIKPGKPLNSGTYLLKLIATDAIYYSKLIIIK